MTLTSDVIIPNQVFYIHQKEFIPKFFANVPKK